MLSNVKIIYDLKKPIILMLEVTAEIQAQINSSNPLGFLSIVTLLHFLLFYDPPLYFR